MLTLRLIIGISMFSLIAWGDLAPSGLKLVGSYRSDGVYNLVGLGTWNGQPVSQTNRPTDFQAQLATTLNFYELAQNPNDLFLQVTGVVTTNGSYWSGLAFNDVSLTGIQFSLPTPSKSSFGTPTFSGQYANLGQVQFTGNGSMTVPLSDTPGYTLDALGNQTFFIHTVNGAENAFGTWGYVYGATRIMGGGVFELNFPGNLGSLSDVNFRAADVESVYGASNQFIPAVWEGPVNTPEPYLILPLAVGFLGLIGFRRQRISRLERIRDGGKVQA
jgi:hypothetical protein